ncbi:hypothetical protein [Lachnoclostridium sp. Marseille-P6806]|uniref:hypothetical protein n=1 Tax=Lachnoclostridium sp. Marseille-P6806 TaxID=2364793 RepID=UPI001030BBBF|nr:hypothetical protein [Lachnoclostridium sp. Marseille-P6806]
MSEQSLSLLGIAAVFLLLVLIPLLGYLIRKLSFRLQVNGTLRTKRLDEQSAAAAEEDRTGRNHDVTPYIDAETQSNIHHHFP